MLQQLYTFTNMAKRLFITQPIDNDPQMGREGFTDKIDNDIRQNQGELFSTVNSPGGDIFKAAQIFRTLSEHEGKTHALVVGIAASAAGLLLVAFDLIEADEDSRIMLHKAHVDGVKTKDLTPEQQHEIKVFNEQASAKLIAKGKSNGIDNEVLVKDIFLNEKSGDFFFSAKEAKEKLGLVDEVTKVSRNNGVPTVQIAASQNQNIAKIIYESYNKIRNMGLFGNKKPIVARAEALKDGRVIVFNSVDKTLAKGDKVALIGSNESLKGNLELKSGIVAEIDENNEVLNIEEETIDNQTPEEVAQMIQEIAEKIATIEERIAKLEGGEAPEDKSDEEKEKEELEAKTKLEAEAKEKGELKAEVKELGDKLTSVVDALTKNPLTTDFKIPKFEKKIEAMQGQLNLGDSRERAIDLKGAINAPVNNKSNDN